MLNTTTHNDLSEDANANPSNSNSSNNNEDEEPQLHDEIWSHSFAYLSTAELKYVSTVSRQFRDAACVPLWRRPQFCKMMTRDEVTLLRHLPIHTMHTFDMKMSSYEEADDFSNLLHQLPAFKELVVDVCPCNHFPGHSPNPSHPGNKLPASYLPLFSPWISAIYTAGVLFDDTEEFVAQLVSKSALLPRLRSVVLNGYFNEDDPTTCCEPFSLADLRAMDNLPVVEVHLSALVYIEADCKRIPSDWEPPKQMPQIPHLFQMQKLKSIVVNTFIDALLLLTLQGLPVTRVYLPTLLFPTLLKVEKRAFIRVFVEMGITEAFLRDIHDVDCGYGLNYRYYALRTKDLLWANKLPLVEVDQRYIDIRKSEAEGLQKGISSSTGKLPEE